MKQYDIRKAEMITERTCHFDMNKFVDTKNEVGKMFPLIIIINKRFYGG